MPYDKALAKAVAKALARASAGPWPRPWQGHRPRPAAGFSEGLGQGLGEASASSYKACFNGPCFLHGDHNIPGPDLHHESLSLGSYMPSWRQRLLESLLKAFKTYFNAFLKAH